MVALNMVSDIGSVRLGRLLEYFEKPENIFKASVGKLTQALGIGGKIAAQITSLKNADLKNELSAAERLGLEIITLYDSGYPPALKNIPAAPILLYAKGELKKEDSLAIGIVGSRRASFYGMNTAERFSFELAQNNFTVVSGLARGIDTCAHKGALKAGGRTIAVIGSGFNHIYPPENIDLAGQISETGAVVSEFSVNTRPLPNNFPRRNRVISGLSLGVLVVEAALNSGAIITADFALEQGREVFAVPGKIDSANSSGVNGLIKQGAKLVSCVEDITEEFVQPSGAVIRGAAMPDENFVLDNNEEARVYGMINKNSVQLDELLEKTSLDIPRISDILLRLRLKKLVRELPGKQYVRRE